MVERLLDPGVVLEEACDSRCVIRLAEADEEFEANAGDVLMIQDSQIQKDGAE